MKKIRMLIPAVLLISLTSCQAHLGEKVFFLPWWAIALPIILVLVIAHLCIIRKLYRCPYCQARFQPKWYEFSSWLHMGDHRALKCPHCGKRGFFPPER